MTDKRCTAHGELEANVSNLKDEMQELKDGQKTILDKIEVIILTIKDRTFEDFKNCSNHRSEVLSITNDKLKKEIEPLKKDVKANTSKINKILAFFGAIGTILAYIKYIS